MLTTKSFFYTVTVQLVCAHTCVCDAVAVGLCSDASCPTLGRQRERCVPPDSPAAAHPKHPPAHRGPGCGTVAAATPVPNGIDS